MPSDVFESISLDVMTALKDREKAIFSLKQGEDEEDLEVSAEAIFSHRHQSVDKDGRPYGDARPIAWILVSSGVSPSFGDKVEISGMNFTIKEIKPDGHEIMELTLVED